MKGLFRVLSMLGSHSVALRRLLAADKEDPDALEAIEQLKAKRRAEDAYINARIRELNEDSRQQERRTLFLNEFVAASGANRGMSRPERRKLARAYAKKAWLAAA
jgi:hypothetical protein